MKRREFLFKSSAALAAVAASDLWVSRVMAGEAVPFGASLLDTYFHVTKADIGKVIASRSRQPTAQSLPTPRRASCAPRRQAPDRDSAWTE